MQLNESLSSTDASPFWLGIVISLAVATMSWLVLGKITEEWEPEFRDDPKRLEKYRARLVRDFDVTQGAAVTIPWIIGIVLVGGRESRGLEVLIVAGGGLAAIAVTAKVWRASATRYEDRSHGIFTPLTVATVVANLFGLAVVVLGG